VLLVSDISLPESDISPMAMFYFAYGEQDESDFNLYVLEESERRAKIRYSVETGCVDRQVVVRPTSLPRYCAVICRHISYILVFALVGECVLVSLRKRRSVKT
jgi:hypothetical protein